MNDYRTDKKKTTLYIDRNIDSLAKKILNRSEVAEEAFKVALDVKNSEEAVILNKIADIDVQIEKLKLKKKLYSEQLLNSRNRTKELILEKERNMAFKSIVKELKETNDVNEDNLTKNAKILGIKEDELLKRAMAYLGLWNYFLKRD